MQHELYQIAPAGPSDIQDVVPLFQEYESHIGVDLSYQDFASELSANTLRPPDSSWLRATPVKVRSDASRCDR